MIKHQQFDDFQVTVLDPKVFFFFFFGGGGEGLGMEVCRGSHLDVQGCGSRNVPATCLYHPRLWSRELKTGSWARSILDELTLKL